MGAPAEPASNLSGAFDMTRPLKLASAALLFAALAPRPTPAQTRAAKAPVKASTKTPQPCSLLTADEIKSITGAAAQPGRPGANDCTWKDAKGEDRVYISVHESLDWHNLHDTMRGTGKLTPLTGVAEDAFFVSSSGSSAALYLLKGKHYVIFTITGPNASKADNEAAEKALAPQILSRL